MLKFLMLGFSSLLLGPSWWGRLSLWSLGALVCTATMVSVYPEYGVGGSLVGSSLRTSLIGLSFWILAVIVMGSGPFKGSYPFLVSLSFLLLFLVLSFSLDSLLGFYVSFEASLIPTLVLVLGWGYQPERVQAGVYMMFYTLIGSLPLLLMLVSLKEEGSSSMISGVPMATSSWWWMMGALAFFMKLPMFSVHLWLPKAHVEAPAAGSMILAGVLLKLGGYGLISLVDKAGLVGDVSVGITGLGLMGGCLIGLVCLAQSDMKSLVAYSSVAHMSLCLAGALVFNSWGVNGTLTVMLGHGLCSSGLFYLVNLVYLRSNSRSMLLSKGGVNFIPTLTLWWFLFCVSNMAAPPTLNLLGEVQLMVSLMGWDYWSGISLFIMALGGGAYSLFLFYSTQHGAMSEAAGGYPPMSLNEGMTLFLHWAPLNLLFLKGETVVSVI